MVSTNGSIVRRLDTFPAHVALLSNNRDLAMHRAHDADILITNINTRSPFITPLYFSSHTLINTNTIQVSNHPKDV
jgi:hypothetical protein